MDSETKEVSIQKSVKHNTNIQIRQDVREHGGAKREVISGKETTLMACKAFARTDEASSAAAHAGTRTGPRDGKGCRAVGIQHDPSPLPHTHRART